MSKIPMLIIPMCLGFAISRAIRIGNIEITLSCIVAFVADLAWVVMKAR